MPNTSLTSGAAREAIALMVVLVFSIRPTAAQIPEKFTNLRVLPREIPRRELILRMRWFASGLGVRCDHCHVGKNVETLEGFDFASDEKETKKIARAMMRIVQEINDKLPQATGRETPHLVSCITCHRGSRRPLTLHELMTETARKDGVEAALKQYREMREKHFGDGLYDFSPRSLSAFSETLSRELKDQEGALGAARLNAEFHPLDPHVHILIGQICLQKGDRDGAVAAFGKAAELAPDDAWVREQLDAARTPPAPPK